MSIAAPPAPGDLRAEPTETDLVKLMVRRFHIVARQLTRRHANRETLEIRDEYDVQDLLHALLRLRFDDVRPEEWTPSYAGGSSRMDFLLKNEKLVVEAKMTRTGLAEKQIGEQLIVDAARYSTHPDCTILVCFIYDPEAQLKNPRGLEADLAKLSRPGLRVSALIAPGIKHPSPHNRPLGFRNSWRKELAGPPTPRGDLECPGQRLKPSSAKPRGGVEPGMSFSNNSRQPGHLLMISAPHVLLTGEGLARVHHARVMTINTILRAWGVHP